MNQNNSSHINQKMKIGHNSIAQQAGRDINNYNNAPKSLIDPYIAKEIETIKRARFIANFDAVGNSLRLGERLINGELSCGSENEKGKALAWCARTLAYTKHIEKAKIYLEAARNNTIDNTVKIAEAFVLSKTEGKNAALQLLGEINTTEAISTSLLIIAKNGSAKDAIEWMCDTGYTVHDLDSEGKLRLLLCQLTLCNWKEAESIVAALGDSDFIETPQLHYIVAFEALVSTVPNEQRVDILNNLPYHIYDFSLGSTDIQIKQRQKSIKHFQIYADIAKGYDCYEAAGYVDRYRLWLELNDPELNTKAKEYIVSKISGIDSLLANELDVTLGYINFAIELGLELDIEEVERIIDQQIARNGKITLNSAFARLAIVYTKSSISEKAEYLDKYYSQLSEQLLPKFLDFRRIELFSKAGMISDAKKIFNRLLDKGLPDYEKRQLQQILENASPDDVIETLKVLYQEKNELNVLRQLVDELKKSERWEELCEYGNLLFTITEDFRDAELLMSALTNTNKTEKLVGFLQANNHLLALSVPIKYYYAHGLYYEGEFQEARDIIQDLQLCSKFHIEQNLRQMRLFLEINSGNWNYITEYVYNEIKYKQTRNAEDLLNTAYLALNHNIPKAIIKELLSEAVSKDSDNPNILVYAHFIATQCKLEAEKEVSSWLNRAAESLDPNSPLKSISFEELIALQPKWNKQVQDIGGSIERAGIPLFIAAKQLNQTYTSLTLFSALLNVNESDLRGKKLIPAFAGNRDITKCDLSNKNILLDPSAILNLAFLGILELVVDSCKSILIPHGTLSWLYKEKQDIVFHQPKRIAEARVIADLVNNELLEKFQSSSKVNGDLKYQIGYENAALISEAKFHSSDENQHIAALSFPVYAIDSLLKNSKEVDLSEYTDTICSVYDIIDKLKQNGVITTTAHKDAYYYFQIHGEIRSKITVIPDEARVYLSSPTLYHLLQLDLLDKIKRAKIIAVIPPQSISETKALISYESTSKDVMSIIESIRSTLNDGITSNKIKVGRKRDAAKDDQNIPSEHPTIDLIYLTPYCDCAAIDDRYINKNINISSFDIDIPILSTIDILHFLQADDIITESELFDSLTKLRIAGYGFIPITDTELEYGLNRAIDSDSNFCEIAELKAIRESILLVRMRDWLHLPQEISWFAKFFLSYSNTIKKLWNDDDFDYNTSKLKSNWLFKQLDVRGWAHSFKEEEIQFIIYTKYVHCISVLLIPRNDKNMEEYWRWVEEDILLLLKDNNQEAYTILTNIIKEILINCLENMMSQYLPEERSSQLRNQAIFDLLGFISPHLKQNLLNDKEFCSNYDIIVNSVISFVENSTTFIRSNLTEAVRKAWLTQQPVEINDINGIKSVIATSNTDGDLPKVELIVEENKLIINTLPLLADDISIRMKCFDAFVKEVNLPRDSISRWHGILNTRSLTEEEVVEFQSDINDTSYSMENKISEILNTGKFQLSSLVPNSKRYYERLVGVYDGSASIEEYSKTVKMTVINDFSQWDSYEQFLFSLYLSSHSSITDKIDISSLDSEILVKKYDYLYSEGDILSCIGAIEIGLRILPNIPEIENAILSLIDKVINDDVSNNKSSVLLFSSVFVLVDSELTIKRLFQDTPPFYRRFAALTHASLICRQLLKFDFDYKDLFNKIYSIYVHTFYLQSYKDGTLEPRWLPNYSTPQIIKQDLLGRIIIAGERNKEEIRHLKIFDVIRLDKENIITQMCYELLPFLPSPLEGGQKFATALTSEYDEHIKSIFGKEYIDASSFFELINLAYYYNLNSSHAELVINALKNNNYRINNLNDNNHLLAILQGISFIAATTKNCELAEIVYNVTKNYRLDSQITLSISQSIIILLISASAFEDDSHWQNFIGNYFNEFALTKMQPTDIQELKYYMYNLLELFPELWATCSKAEAAISYIPE